MKYNVYYQTTIEGWLEVDAENEEEARMKAADEVYDELKLSGCKFSEIETFV